MFTKSRSFNCFFVTLNTPDDVKLLKAKYSYHGMVKALFHLFCVCLMLLCVQKIGNICIMESLLVVLADLLKEYKLSGKLSGNISGGVQFKWEILLKLKFHLRYSVNFSKLSKQSYFRKASGFYILFIIRILVTKNNPFDPSAHIPYPRKTLEGFLIFSKCRERCIGNNGLKWYVK